MNRMCVGVFALVAASGTAFAGSISLDLGVESMGVVDGIGPATGSLFFNDDISDHTRNMRLFNKVVSADNVQNPTQAIDGNIDTFARVGGLGFGDPGDDDGEGGALNLTFDNGFTFNRSATIVFTEFGNEDEPFSVSIEIGGTLFEISTDIAGTVDGVTEYDLLDGLKFRVFELDLSASYFDALGTGGTYNIFSITDATGSTNLSPDINLAGVVVPLPGAAGMVLAGFGFVAGSRRRNEVR